MPLKHYHFRTLRSLLLIPIIAASAIVSLSISSSVLASNAESAGANTSAAVVNNANIGPSSPGSSLVISKVYAGGGQTNSTYRNDYVELFNPSTSDISVNGMSLQTTSRGTTSNWVLTPLSGTVRAGGYYLIKLSTSGSPTLLLPTPDASNTLSSTNLSALAGKVAVVTNTTLLTCGSDHAVNTCQGNPAIIDFVGYGHTASDYEGLGPGPSSGATIAVTRNRQGNDDSNDNRANFTATHPTWLTPRLWLYWPPK